MDRVVAQALVPELPVKVRAQALAAVPVEPESVAELALSAVEPVQPVVARALKAVESLEVREPEHSALAPELPEIYSDLDR